MCGRLVCALCFSEYVRRCGFKEGSSPVILPPYINYGRNYFRSSYNVCPKETVPVLLDKRHIPEKRDSLSKYAVMPMQWGLIPIYAKDMSVAIHNSRIENIERSGVFRMTLQRRCVVLCDGYFEWHTLGSVKQPYYITQEKLPSVQPIEDQAVKEWCGNGPVMKLAGLFNIYPDPSSPNENSRYSCAVITTEATSNISWIHDRMPVILKTVDDVDNWLDSEVNTLENLAFLRSYRDHGLQYTNESKYQLKYHPVDKNFVNRASCKDAACIAATTHKRQSTLDSWVSKRGPASSSK